MAEPGEHRLRREDVAPGRGELDGKGQPVEARG